MKENSSKEIVETQETVTYLIAHMSLRVPSREDWYFDSGCSRNMIGENNYLAELKSYSNSYVNFGNGAKGRIKRICKVESPSFPCLDDVLLVEGLTANLINISQLCD